MDIRVLEKWGGGAPYSNIVLGSRFQTGRIYLSAVASFFKEHVILNFKGAGPTFQFPVRKNDQFLHASANISELPTRIVLSITAS